MTSVPDVDVPIPPPLPRVPFFSDFDLKTYGFWRRSSYSLGRQFQIEADSRDNLRSVRVTVVDGSSVSSDISANFTTKWGGIEVTQGTHHGPSVEVRFNNVFRQWNLRSRHTANSTDVTTDYRPEGSFWCTRLDGHYMPDFDGERICSGKASIVVQDNQYNLAVGGEVELEDRRESTKNSHNQWLKNYSMGFLYSPTDTTQYSLLYSPDKESNGVEYDLALFKRVNDNLSVAGRAQGKADLRNTSVPTMFLGASWFNNGNLMRGFVNSRKEYGASYEVGLTEHAHITLGLASFLSPDADNAQAEIGFKLHFGERW